MESLSKPQITPEEYLERERQAPFKSEYFDGQVYAMSGGKENHNLLVANLIALLWPLLKGGNCRVYPSDLKIATPSGKRYFYPDVSVICGETRFIDQHNDVATNPTVLVEVLSDSTAAFDRGTKFLAYQAIPSLREYLLIHQDSCLIEQFRRHEGESWLYTKTEGVSNALELASLQCSLQLADIYLNVKY